MRLRTDMRSADSIAVAERPPNFARSARAKRSAGNRGFGSGCKYCKRSEVLTFVVFWQTLTVTGRQKLHKERADALRGARAPASAPSKGRSSATRAKQQLWRLATPTRVERGQTTQDSRNGGRQGHPGRAPRGRRPSAQVEEGGRAQAGQAQGHEQASECLHGVWRRLAIEQAAKPRKPAMFDATGGPPPSMQGSVCPAERQPPAHALPADGRHPQEGGRRGAEGEGAAGSPRRRHV